MHTRAAWHRSVHVRNLKTYLEKYWGDWYFCCNSHTQFAENDTKNIDIIHLFPQLWWERHKWHCGWRKGPGNRQRSSYLGKYPHQSPKTEEQVFASSPRSAGLEELRQACVNLSTTQKEQKCERGKDRAGASHIAVGNRTLGCQWYVLWAENKSFYVDFSEPKQIAFSIEHHPVHWRNPIFKLCSHFTYIRPRITLWYYKTLQNNTDIAMHPKVCRLGCFVEDNLLFCSRTKRFSVKKQRRHLRPARFAK